MVSGQPHNTNTSGMYRYPPLSGPPVQHHHGHYDPVKSEENLAYPGGSSSVSTQLYKLGRTRFTNIALATATATAESATASAPARPTYSTFTSVLNVELTVTFVIDELQEQCRPTASRHEIIFAVARVWRVWIRRPTVGVIGALKH